MYGFFLYICGMEKTPNFYCRIHSGSDDFSIKEYNETAKVLELTDMTESEKMKILHPEPCNTQCDTCKMDVAKRRKQTRNLSLNK